MQLQFLLDREITEDAVKSSIVRIFWTGLLMSPAHFLAFLGFWAQIPSEVPVEAILQ